MFRAFFFRRPATPESAAIRSLPRGGGLGRGHSPEWRQSFPNTLTAPIQALRLAALSLTLSHGREDGRLLGLRVLQGNRLCRLLFTFQTTFNQRQIQESRSPHVGCVRYARVLHFPCNPNPPRACLAAHTLPMGSKVV